MTEWRQSQTQAKLINLSFTDWETIEFDFFEFYDSHYQYFDDYILFTYGDRKVWLCDDETSPETVYNRWHRYTSSIVHSKAYEYQRMWNALKSEYDPIENYNKMSEITTEGDEHTDTQKNPEVTVTNSGGTSTTTSGTSPYDSTDFGNTDKVTSVIPQTTNKTSGHDVEMVYGDTKTTVKEKTHGNIGVTTNQQMITSELELRKNNFIIGIIHDIINHTTIY